MRSGTFPRVNIDAVETSNTQAGVILRYPFRFHAS